MRAESRDGIQPRKRKLLWIGAAGVLGGLIAVSVGVSWLVKWLWMAQLGYETIFWRLWSTRLILFIGAFGLTLAYCWGHARRLLRSAAMPQPGEAEWSPNRMGLEDYQSTVRQLRAPLMAFSGLAAVVFGFIFSGNWDTFFRFYWSQTVAQTDPIYQRDIGFYLFRLPLYELFQNSALWLTLVVLAAVVLGYTSVGAVQRGANRQWLVRPPVLRHLCLTALPLLACWGWGYYLDRFELLYGQGGVVFGAGYTDVNVVTICLTIMVVASVGLGVVIGLTMLLNRMRLLLFGAGSYLGLHALIIILVPGVVQLVVVKPNELELETPYLQHNIAFTRQSYGLDRIDTRDYPALEELSFAEVMQHDRTLRNIRLWDWRPLIQTYRQMQEIRLYYHFYDVDVDRYHLDGDYRQVMLSARELGEQLPRRARTWVNRRLQYTHGYGLVMSLVSQAANRAGVPEFVVKDVPPIAKAGVHVSQPAIYYGEHTPGYRIVNTTIKELDYPKGDANVYTQYTGRGGIRIDTWWKRLVFAWNTADISILLSSYITPASRMQLWRQVQDRVRQIAPFLRLDRDPYLVVSAGKLFWIQDAYTVSDYFPYAEPYQNRFNYIRNAVKVVVDVYHGSVEFYVMDPSEPILQVYRQAFPGVFKGLERMPQDIRRHLRYPMDLFTVQVDKFRTYHMTVPQVFYNNEDLWAVPREKYAGRSIRMEPYYLLMRLPETEHLQFLLMQPLTPNNRDNMIAWMAAKSDFPNYGQLVVYKLPKERLIYGPLQIEAKIDQDTEISQHLSLWDQRGSKVIRGNLLVIPMHRSFLYVEPVFLIAEGTDIPQLRRVIVAYGDQVAMEPTLEQALRAVFGAPTEQKQREAAKPAPGMPSDLRRTIERAEQALQQGDWTAFGKQMDALKQLVGAEPQPGSTPESPGTP
jgi:uncharacterized membrane protein (UPF0182 family)